MFNLVKVFLMLLQSYNSLFGCCFGFSFENKGQKGTTVACACSTAGSKQAVVKFDQWHRILRPADMQTQAADTSCHKSKGSQGSQHTISDLGSDVAQTWIHQCQIRARGQELLQMRRVSQSPGCQGQPHNMSYHLFMPGTCQGTSGLNKNMVTVYIFGAKQDMTTRQKFRATQNMISGRVLYFTALQHPKGSSLMKDLSCPEHTQSTAGVGK